MSFAFFAAPGRFLRGNLHTHSTRSDGTLDPVEVSRRYRAMGYDFLCISDHFMNRFGFPITDTTGHRTDGFTTLIGAELHAGTIANGEVWHILANGLPADFAPTGKDETGPQLARRAVEAGAFVSIAHPQWYGLTIEDAHELDFVHAVEIYNHTCAVRTERPDGTHLLDQLLAEGQDFFAIATDDAHFIDPVNPNADAFGGWVMVKAEENTPDALLTALKSGHFYASQGPEFRSIRIEGDRAEIETSAVSRIVALGPRARSRDVSGHAMTRCNVPLKGFEGDFVRFVAIDAAGKRAWSNPLRL